MKQTITGWLRTILFLPPESSTMAPAIDRLHMSVIITTMVGASCVGLLAIYFVIKYRRRGPAGTHPRTSPLSATPMWKEGVIAGALFALFFAWWVVGFTQYVDIRVPPGGTYDVYVTAKQWMWKFSYPEGQRTIGELYVPAGRPVKLIMTSRDVIHSFYVPDFRLKQDVLPGRYTTLWFEAPEPGRHQVFCAEYCGTNHSRMYAQVIVLEPAAFSRWVAQHSATAEEASQARIGEQVAAQQGCLRCHTLDGTPHIGPTWAGLYLAEVPLAGGGKAVADEAYLTESMMDPLAKIHAGFKPVMPSYLGRLAPGQVAAMVELIKSLRDVPSGGQHPTLGTRPVATPPAGLMGQPPAPPTPGLQPVPPEPAPPPAEQGLPPPGAVVVPPAAGAVEVGPNGPTPAKENP